MRQAEKVGPPSMTTAGQICRSTSPIKMKPGQNTAPEATEQRTPPRKLQATPWQRELVAVLGRCTDLLYRNQRVAEDDLGFSEGHLSHLKIPNGDNGRVAQPQTIQKWIEGLARRGVKIAFTVEIGDQAVAMAAAAAVAMAGTAAIPLAGARKTRSILHFRDAKYFSAIGTKGSLATKTKYRKHLSRWGRKGARARWAKPQRATDGAS